MTFITRETSSNYYEEARKERVRLFSLLKDRVPSDLITERQDLIYDYQNQDQINEEKLRAFYREERFFWQQNQTKS